MENLTGKGKHAIKVRNNPHTSILSKPMIVRGGEYKYRLFETHLKLRDNLKQSCCVCIYIYVYYMHLCI